MMISIYLLSLGLSAPGRPPPPPPLLPSAAMLHSAKDKTIDTEHELTTTQVQQNYHSFAAFDRDTSACYWGQEDNAWVLCTQAGSGPPSRHSRWTCIPCSCRNLYFIISYWWSLGPTLSILFCPLLCCAISCLWWTDTGLAVRFHSNTMNQFSSLTKSKRWWWW